jgi:hypothetical protein
MENKLKDLQDKFKVLSLRTELEFNKKFLEAENKELRKIIQEIDNEEPNKKAILRKNKLSKKIFLNIKQLKHTYLQLIRIENYLQLI